MGRTAGQILGNLQPYKERLVVQLHNLQPISLSMQFKVVVFAASLFAIAAAQTNCVGITAPVAHSPLTVVPK
jgi:hypothetical protein